MIQIDTNSRQLPTLHDNNEIILLLSGEKQIRYDEHNNAIAFKRNEDTPPEAIHTWSKKHSDRYSVFFGKKQTLSQEALVSGQVFGFTDYDPINFSPIVYNDQDTQYSRFFDKAIELSYVIQRQPIGELGSNYRHSGNSICIMNPLPVMHFINENRISYEENPKIDKAVLNADETMSIFTAIPDWETSKPRFEIYYIERKYELKDATKKGPFGVLLKTIRHEPHYRNYYKKK